MSIHNTSITETQGRRMYMEDTYKIEEIKKRNGNIKVFCVFDGHGGKYVSEYCMHNVIPILRKHVQQYPELDVCLCNTYKELDMGCINIGNMCGSTAAIVLVKNNELWFSNCGDTEILVGFTDGNYKIMSDNHKVENEKTRIIKAGGTITYDDGCARVNRMLNVGRSIGDYHLKKYIISTPAIKSIKKMINKVEFILIASDGLWDVFQEKELYDMIIQIKTEMLDQKKNKQELADHIGFSITKEALLKGSMDNICVLLHFL